MGRFFLALLMTAVLSTGCKFEGGIFDPNSVLGDDFRKTLAVSSPRGVADNYSELVLTLQFVNENSKVIAGYLPLPIFTGVTQAGTCTVTDSSGKSSCRFKTDTPGTYVVQFSFPEADWSYQTSITFDPYTRRNLGLAPAGQQKMTGVNGAGTWKAAGTLGSTTSGATFTGPGGWKAYIDVQPSISSQ